MKTHVKNYFGKRIEDHFQPQLLAPTGKGIKRAYNVTVNY